MACHILGAPNLALRLGAPTSVECIKKEGTSSFMFPKSSTIKFEFPARGSMPPVTLFWHDGLKEMPKFDGVPEGELVGDIPSARRFGGGRGAGRGQGQPPAQRPPAPPPNGFVGQVFNYEEYEKMMQEAKESGQQLRMPSPDGSLFIGDKGMITTGTYGEQTRLLPVEKMKDYHFPPELLTRSPGHYRDWIRAAKGGDPACSNFSVSGPFTEWIVMAVISLRVEGKLEWDPGEDAVHQQQRSQQVREARLPQGMGPELESVV